VDEALRNSGVVSMSAAVLGTGNATLTLMDEIVRRWPGGLRRCPCEAR